MLFSELYKIMVKKVTFVGFRGAIAPIASPGSAPVYHRLKVHIIWVSASRTQEHKECITTQHGGGVNRCGQAVPKKSKHWNSAAANPAVSHRYTEALHKWEKNEDFTKHETWNEHMERLDVVAYLWNKLMRCEVVLVPHCVQLWHNSRQKTDKNRAGPSRCGAPLSSGVITSSCTVNRAMTFLMKIF